MSFPSISIVAPLSPTGTRFSIHERVSVSGASATGTNVVKVDLNQVHQRDGYGILEVQVASDPNSETPTSPGSTKKITLKVATCDTDINDPIYPGLDVTGAPTILAAVTITTLDCNLLDTAFQDLIFRSDPFTLPARYVYVWLDNDTLADNAVVLVSSSISVVHAD